MTGIETRNVHGCLFPGTPVLMKLAFTETAGARLTYSVQRQARPRSWCLCHHTRVATQFSCHSLRTTVRPAFVQPGGETLAFVSVPLDADMGLEISGPPWITGYSSR